MLLEKLEIILCLFAALIFLIVGLVVRAEFTFILSGLLISIVAFYIVGLVIRKYLQSRIFPPEPVHMYDDFDLEADVLAGEDEPAEETPKGTAKEEE